MIKKLFIILSLLLVNSCSSTLKLYDAKEFSQKQIATIEIDDGISILKIDKTYIKEDVSKIELLSGLHLIEAIFYRESYRGTGTTTISQNGYSYTTNSEKKLIEQGEVSKIIFKATAGKKYIIKAYIKAGKWTPIITEKDKIVSENVRENIILENGVLYYPKEPFAGKPVTIVYHPLNTNLDLSNEILIRWGINNWNIPKKSKLPLNSKISNDLSCIESGMLRKTIESEESFVIEISTEKNMEEINFEFSDGKNIDNNNGKKWCIKLEKN